MPPLILASTSPYRRELLARLGVPFTVAAPGVDESIAKQAGGTPQAIAERLAQEKARAVARLHPTAVVIGSDQVAVVDGRRLDKPGGVEAAVDMLMALQGRTHALITAVTIVHPAGEWQHTDTTRLTFRRFGRDRAEAYVAADRPLDCAGGYKLEQRGIALVASLQSDDQTAIIGLPLLAVGHCLAGLGFPIP